jgi:hypothetical protein
MQQPLNLLISGFGLQPCALHYTNITMSAFNKRYIVRGMQCDVFGTNCERDIVCGCNASYTYLSCRILV